MLELTVLLEPAIVVVNPDQTRWGRGQIQSIINDRITVNFEHTGKLVIDGSPVPLQPRPIRGGS